MNSNILPHELPNSKIINELAKKTGETSTSSINFIQCLDNLRNIISLQTSRINVLFPEYTPHDEKYHLKRLFVIADELLGDELIAKMNVVELFLLSISLYGHDWGMAVSEDEKNSITNRDYNNTENVYLKDEKNRFDIFCREKRIETDSIVSNEDWREYVRITHAFRSGLRINKHFESIDTNLGEFASRISEGHWLDFDIIDDYRSYPSDASIMGYSVNIKALTIYVRLVDLMDIASDRTPYVLWKFISPQNAYSQIEWQKHQALSPVTFPNYNSGRVIQIDGSTDNIDVYLSLMDLKRYVDDQFRHCNDLLNRTSTSYHRLNISHIDWRINAKGFEPVLIQFEFDRARMFDILGDEIYQSNPYVFIRELLQNSIDAIKMRLEIYERGEMSFKPKITIKVEENDENYFISIKDNGIGMDEYIVKNYLTVAGKSYYKSNDFKKEGLNMDPISKFGIGVLSCFMNADFLEIETYRDPLTKSKVDPLKISVLSKQNYLKIEKTSNFEIGSTFIVHIIKETLPKVKKENERVELKVIEFIKKTAGFVKFPIIIEEQGVVSTILNPSAFSNLKTNEFTIDYSFKYDSAFQPQYHDSVQKYFKEHKINLASDLKLQSYEGCITFLVPINDNLDIISIGRSWPNDQVQIFDYQNCEVFKEKIKWERDWMHNRYYTPSAWYLFSERSYEIYLDGIWVKDITPPQITLLNDDGEEDPTEVDAIQESFISGQWRVNIPKPNDLKIDVARTKLNTKEKWDKPIWQALFQYLKKQIIPIEKAESNCKLLLKLAGLVTFYNIPPSILLTEFINPEELAIPFYTKNDQVKFENFNSIKGKFKIIKRLDLSLEDYISQDLLFMHFKKKDLDKNLFSNWIGEEILIPSNRYYQYSNKLPSSIKNCYFLINHFISKNYYISKIEFISSYRGIDFPIVQEILELKNCTEILNPEQFLDLIEDNDLSNLSTTEVTIINRHLSRYFNFKPYLVYFAKPFSESFAFNNTYLNINHPITKILVKISIATTIKKKTEKISKKNIGILKDLLGDITILKSIYIESDIDCLELNEQILELVSKVNDFKLFRQNLVVNHKLNIEDFVKNSLIPSENEISLREFVNNKELEQIEWGEKLI